MLLAAEMQPQAHLVLRGITKMLWFEMDGLLSYPPPIADPADQSFISCPMSVLREILRVFRGFPGGSVVKNLPDNAGDSGSIPDPGRSHVQQSN